EDVARQRGRRRFAVGAGDGYDWRAVLSVGANLAREELDIADHFGIGVAGSDNDLMWRGMGKRHAGAEDQSPNLLPRPVAPRQNGRAFSLRRDTRRLLVVPRIDARAAGLQRTHGRKAASGEPEDANVLMREGADGDHSYLSFKVERPISASTTATIQKRITMVGSFQPSCSKW